MKTLKLKNFICLITLSFCVVGCASTATSPHVLQELLCGEEALTQEKYAEAVDHLTTYLSKAPGDADAHLKLGCALLKNGQLDEAIPQFKEFISLKPEDGESRLLIKNSIYNEAAKFYEKNTYDVAIRYLISYLTIDSTDVDTHILLTRYFLAMGNDRNAIGSLKNAASLEPRNPEVIELLDYFSSGFH